MATGSSEGDLLAFELLTVTVESWLFFKQLKF